MSIRILPILPTFTLLVYCLIATGRLRTMSILFFQLNNLLQQEPDFSLHLLFNLLFFLAKRFYFSNKILQLLLCNLYLHDQVAVVLL